MKKLFTSFIVCSLFTTMYSNKIIFNKEEKMIAYQNHVAIKNSTYKIEKGIGYFDKSEYNLVTFKDKTYTIENIDNQNLTIVSNHQDGTPTIFKR